MHHLHFILLLVVGVALLARIEKAEACTCSPDIRGFPANEATGVPLNVHPAIFARSGLYVTSFQLLTANGQPVLSEVETRTRSRHRDTLVTFTPRENLQPRTRYQILVGTQVATTFVTDEHVDETTPEVSPLQTFSAETMQDGSGNSCVGGFLGIQARLWLEYSITAPEAAYYILKLRSETSEYWTDDWILLSESFEFEDGAIQDLHCGPQPPILRAGDNVCASMTAYDAHGNASPATEEVCATVSRAAGGCAGCGVGPTSDSGLLFVLLALLAFYRRSD